MAKDALKEYLESLYAVAVNFHINSTITSWFKSLEQEYSLILHQSKDNVKSLEKVYESIELFSNQVSIEKLLTIFENIISSDEALNINSDEIVMLKKILHKLPILLAGNNAEMISKYGMLIQDLHEIVISKSISLCNKYNEIIYEQQY